MLALDTNVLVRVLVADDPAQQRAALRRLRAMQERGEPAFVPTVVLAELAWVLASAYDYERKAIAAALRGVLSTPPLVVAQRGSVAAAIAEYEKGRADFADYLIVELARAEGCTKVLTFDRRLLRHPDCETP